MYKINDNYKVTIFLHNLPFFINNLEQVKFVYKLVQLYLNLFLI